MKSNSSQSSDATLRKINCDELQCYNYFENETQIARACYSSCVDSPSNRSCSDNSSPNRVRFSSVLVTAVKTRPRTRTEDKPKLYWTADEIAFLRLQQSMEAKSTRSDVNYKRSKCSLREEEEREHDLFGRSRDSPVVHNVEFKVRDRSNEGTRQMRFESGELPQRSSDKVPRAVDEEEGPHLLAPLIECEWIDAVSSQETLQ